jgi:redox-sensitive bicupin YhaK (pirin superfamily)
MIAGAKRIRSIQRVVDSVRTIEGGGFAVRRPFPTAALPDLDPFLLLDHLGPTDYGPGEAIGAPDHPHRGFETVTYILEGRLEHRDSVGNHGILGPGDVQWMTAGSGVVHSEMPEAGFLRSGGRMHGFQIWVNLPRKDKMVRPRYQDIPSARLPMPRSNDGRVAVKVIAGEALGENAVIETRIPITFLHLVLQSGGTIEIPIATGQTVFAYVIEGTGSAGLIDRTVREGQLVQFADDGDAVALRGPVGNESPASILLLAGSPLHEPVARYGPFVMNTPQEINQAIADYQNGTMGLIENP